MPLQRRNLLNVLQRAGIEAPSNTPRAQEQLFLTYDLGTLAYLLEPLQFPHGSFLLNLPASGNPFLASAMALTPGVRGARFLSLTNASANAIYVGVQVAKPVATWGGAGISTGWWGEQPASSIETATDYPGLSALAPVQMVTNQTEKLDYLEALPGEFLVVSSDLNKTITVAGCWTEPVGRE